MTAMHIFNADIKGYVKREIVMGVFKDDKNIEYNNNCVMMFKPNENQEKAFEKISYDELIELCKL